MKHAFAAAAIATVALGTAPAIAADNWSGLYIGGHVGYGLDRDRASRSSSTVPEPFGAFIFEPGFVSDRTSSDFQSRFESVLGGVQIGYNFQFGPVVLGAEADISFGDMKKDAGRSSSLVLSGTLNAAGAALTNLNPGDVISTGSNTVFAARHDLGTFGTVRGRIGFAFDRYLLFATGGIVVADLRTSARRTIAFTASENLIAAYPDVAASVGTTAANGSTSRLAFGGTVGGGIEAMLAPNWSVKAEYLYMHLPSQTVSVSLAGTTETQTFTSAFHTARLGFNYRF